MAARIVKQSKICAWGVSTLCMQSTFDCWVFIDTLKSFSAFSICFDFRQTCILKMAGHRQNTPKFGPQGKVLSIHTGYFWPLRVQGHSDVIWYIFYFSDFRQPGILKTTDCRAKLTKICGSRLSTYFWLLRVQGHSEVVQCILIFLIFDNLASRKQLAIEHNGLKFGLRGKFLVYTGYL